MISYAAGRAAGWAAVLLLVLPPAGAIKFAKEGVTIPGGVLRMGESADIVCNYIMWRQEQLHSVTWSLQYDGVKTDFFVYRANGEKEVTPGVSLIIVDSDYSEEKTVRVQLTDGRQDEVSLCCDVKVVRDDGYGQMTTKEKEKCSAPARVEAISRGQPLVSAALESPPSGRLGDSLQLVCTGTGLSYSHRLQLEVGGRVVARQGGRRLEHQLTLHRGQFPGGWGVQEAAVSCLVVEGSRVIANSTRTIRLEEAGQPTPRPQGGLPTQRPQLSRTARLTDHHSEPGHPAHPASHPATVPCHAYLLLEQTTIHHSRAGSLLSGRLSEEIKSSLPISRDTGSDRLETELAPAELLSLLGFHGHRVVGVGSSRDGRMVWTLERKYYEFHDEL